MGFRPTRSFEKSKLNDDDRQDSEYSKNSYQENEQYQRKPRQNNGFNDSYYREKNGDSSSYSQRENSGDYNSRYQKNYDDRAPRRPYSPRSFDNQTGRFERNSEFAGSDRNNRFDRNDRNDRYDRNDRNERKSYGYDSQNSNRREGYDRDYSSRPSNQNRYNNYENKERSSDNFFSPSSYNQEERPQRQREYGERSFRSERSSDRGYEQRSYDRKPYEGRSFDRRSSEGRSQERRSFDRDSQENRPFERAPREGRSFDRPYRDNERSFERSDRNDRGDRGDRGQRGERGDRDGFRRNNRFSREGRTSRFRENSDNLFDLDQSILRLFLKRAELLQGVKRDNRIPPSLEKKLRSSWEAGVARVTRDARIARDFFNLLQQIEPIPFVNGEPAFYNLAPQFSPVNIDLPGFASARQLRLMFALAASTGAMANFEVYLSPSMMSTIKAFNQLGGQLWWEGNDKVLSRGGEGLTRHLDKVVPVGEDVLSFYLTLSMALLVPSRLKLVGDGNLRFLDTSALRRYLPEINARMATVIPGQEGIPVRMESAGILPNEFDFSAELPADFIISFVAVSVARSDTSEALTFRVQNHAETARISAELISLFEILSIENSIEENDGILTISYVPATPVFADEIKAELDPLFTTALLSIPAFSAGKCVLRGALNSSDHNCLEFLKSTGLKLNIEDGCIIAEHPDMKLVQPDYSLAPSYPFALVFAALASLSGEEVTLPEYPETITEDIVQGFLAQIGLKVNVENILERTEVSTDTWFLPSSEWGLAISLAAFMRPHIRIANPDSVFNSFPTFWRIYNALPEPDLSAQNQEEMPPMESTRRRIISQHPENFADEIEDEESEIETEISTKDEYNVEENSEEVSENVEQSIDEVDKEQNANTESNDDGFFDFYSK